MTKPSINVFVGHRFIQPYMDDFRNVISNVLKTGSEPFPVSLVPLYADSQVVDGHILRQKIFPMIDHSLFCIFEISEEDKPNVFIELGYAYGKGRRVVITTKGQLPTNLHGLDAIIYSSNKELHERLSMHLPVIFSEAIVRAAKPRDSVPLRIIEVIYDNWVRGKTTKKTEIYDLDLMRRSEADEMIKSYIKSGELKEQNDSVVLTPKGAELFKALIENLGERNGL